MSNVLDRPVYFVPIVTIEVKLDRADSPSGRAVVSEAKVDSYFVSTESVPGAGQPKYSMSQVLERMLF
jgi:hypothetical protein